MKKIAILQSSYIPWKGYFDIIASVDEFIIYDVVQFTRRDFRNRNLIKTPNGLTWLTIPTINKGYYKSSINSIKIQGDLWKKKHWKSINFYYAKSPFYREIRDLIKPIYCEKNFKYLSNLNIELIKLICSYLKIDTPIKESNDFILNDGKNERLIGICKACSADYYLTGPSAKEYISTDLFESKGIKVEFMDYSNYNEYEQLWGLFEHKVSILDLLFNCGPESRNFLKN